VELTADRLGVLADALEALDNPGSGYTVETRKAEIKVDGTVYLVRRNKDNELYIELGD
jgi:hypothetical protein